MKQGGSLLCLQGVTPEEVDDVRRLDLQSLKQRWQPMVQQVRAVLHPGHPAKVDDPEALLRLGLQIKRLIGLLLVWNVELHMKFMVTRADGHEVTVARTDALLPHWENVVYGMGYTRSQGVLINTINRLFLSWLESVRGERAALTRQLSKQDEASTSTRFEMERLPHTLELADGIEESARRERAIILLVALMARSVQTPEQLAKIWALAYPYPVHFISCAEVLEHAMKFAPEKLVLHP